MKKFDRIYARKVQTDPKRVDFEGLQPEIQDLIREYGGTSYDNGLYQIFKGTDAKHWTEAIRRFFPSESIGVEAFARDWQGNVFGYRGAQPACVFLFQPGTGDVFEVSDSIETFHNEELTDHAEEALSWTLWKAWRARFPAPSISQCVAYKKPTFLGGEVVLENLTIADIEVYWEVTGQLLQQVRDLPEGTPIVGVNLAYLN